MTGSASDGRLLHAACTQVTRELGRAGLALLDGREIVVVVVGALKQKIFYV